MLISSAYYSAGQPVFDGVSISDGICTSGIVGTSGKSMSDSRCLWSKCLQCMSAHDLVEEKLTSSGIVVAMFLKRLKRTNNLHLWHCGPRVSYYILTRLKRDPGVII